MKLYKCLIAQDVDFENGGTKKVVISYRIPARLFTSVENAKKIYGPNFVTLLDEIDVDLDPEALQP